MPCNKRIQKINNAQGKYLGRTLLVNKIDHCKPSESWLEMPYGPTSEQNWLSRLAWPYHRVLRNQLVSHTYKAHRFVYSACAEGVGPLILAVFVDQGRETYTIGPSDNWQTSAGARNYDNINFDSRKTRLMGYVAENLNRPVVWCPCYWACIGYVGNRNVTFYRARRRKPTRVTVRPKGCHIKATYIAAPNG